MDKNNNYLNDAENTEDINAPIAENAENIDVISEETTDVSDSTQAEEPVDYEPLQKPESPQAPISELQDNNGYTNTVVSEKKSKLVPVLIGVIAVLLVGVGVLGGVLLSKNKDSSSNDKTDGNEQQTTETSTEASSEPTVKSSDIQKAADAACIDMDAKGMELTGCYILSSDKSKNLNLPSSNFDADYFYKEIMIYFEEANSYEWFIVIENGVAKNAAIGDSWDTKAFGSEETLQVLYDKAIEEVQKAADSKGTQQQEQYTADEVSAMYSAFISENPDPNHTYDDPRYGYYLIDLNEDGSQELLITTEEVEAGSPGVVAAYAINNKKLTQLWITDSRFIGYLCEGNIINSFTAMGQGNGTALYQYKSGDKLDLIDMISSDYSSGSEVIYHNQEVISKAEADSILAQYKKMKFEAKPLTISSTSESKTETTTQAAPKETYMFDGIVATESGSLNLRDKPSADSNVVAQLEKGTKGSIFNVEGYPEWYKIYTDDGRSGYVSAQYIKEYDYSSDNSSSNIVGEQTPWGTFTYTNYKKDAYNNKRIVDPASIGVTLNCDIDAFNAAQDKIRIDNIYFWTVKESTQENKPHDYTLFYTFTGTVLCDSISHYSTKAYLIEDGTNNKTTAAYFYEFDAKLYKGETFCYDGISGYHYGEKITDNSSYTLELERSSTR